MRVILACLLLLAFNVRGDDATEMVPRDDVTRYLIEMEVRHMRELDKRDAYIRKLESIAEKVRNYTANCSET